MKKYLVIICSIALLLSGNAIAQNNQGKADDASRIAITPSVSDQTIPQGAQNLLLNKMKQICAKNGLSGDTENPFFVMDASIDIISKELTATAPPMHALNMSINFYIKDANGAVFSETSYEAKGVGQNETKAYIAGIKNINTKSGQFKAMVERGKTKILEFYNSQCDFIISKAKALHKQGKNGEAIKVLESVPPISKECYDMCMELLAEIEPPVEEPKASSETTVSADGTGSSAMGDEKSIDDEIYLVYMGSKVMGDKLVLNFEFQNRGSKDYEFNDYALDTRALDQNGDAFKVENVKVAGTSGSRSVATIIPGTPVGMECQFAKMDAVSMFEFKYKGRTFRFKGIDISGTSGAVANTSANATALANVIGNLILKLDARVFVEVKGESRFVWKVYSPGKIKTLASATTKGEFEIMAMGDCDSEIKWTKDIVWQWHKATKDNVKEGMLVLYAQYNSEISETSCFYPGKVIAVDELYKNLITIKGRGGDIYKIDPGKVLIVDDSNIE